MSDQATGVIPTYVPPTATTTLQLKPLLTPTSTEPKQVLLNSGGIVSTPEQPINSLLGTLNVPVPKQWCESEPNEQKSPGQTNDIDNLSVSTDEQTDSTPDNLEAELPDLSFQKQYSVFIIHSSLPLSELIKYISKYIPGSDLEAKIGPLRIMRAKGEETMRTLCVFDRFIYDNMVRHGLDKTATYSDFRVVKYDLQERHLPKVRGTRLLFVPAPRQLSLPTVKKQLEDFLDVLIQFDIVTVDSTEKPYNILIPFADRETSSHIGNCYITWNDKVKIGDIAMVKNLLHHSRWLTENNERIDGKAGLRYCDWSRINDPAKIRMSPADRVFTQNSGSSKRQTQIRLRDKQRRQGYRPRNDQPRNDQPRNNYQKSNYQKKMTKKVVSTVELPAVPPPPANVPQTVAYKPLSHVQQPASVRENPTQPQMSMPGYPYPMPYMHYPMPNYPYPYPYSTTPTAEANRMPPTVVTGSTTSNLAAPPISSSTLPNVLTFNKQ